ncbi:MAG TPA: metallophosphoesterase [Tenuifilaceae bacterium]|nr:metallophosphoesterase [Tenuifilaceae bacterium]
MFDIIGDIHGHADKLEALLQKMGYEQHKGHYAHAERKALFIGDYIDRGPKIRETLQIVRSMVESDAAIALMGNHEYNAICFHFPETEGGHLRKHEIKNILQHYATLEQFQNRQQEYDGYIDWFKTLPLFYENDHFRAVHACWDKGHIALLRGVLSNGCLNDQLIYESAKKGGLFNLAIEDTLKGKELILPGQIKYKDADGHYRSEYRIKWWEDPTRMNYKSIAVEALKTIPELPIDPISVSGTDYYNQNEKPVFFGHYWLQGQPFLYRDNICCVDFSVAKMGVLAAYRFDGEKVLESDKLVWV